LAGSLISTCTSTDSNGKRFIAADAVIECYGQDAGATNSDSTIYLSPVASSSSAFHCYSSAVQAAWFAVFEGVTAGEFSLELFDTDDVFNPGGNNVPCTTVKVKKHFFTVGDKRILSSIGFI